MKIYELLKEQSSDFDWSDLKDAINDLNDDEDYAIMHPKIKENTVEFEAYVAPYDYNFEVKMTHSNNKITVDLFAENLKGSVTKMMLSDEDEDEDEELKAVRQKLANKLKPFKASKTFSDSSEELASDIHEFINKFVQPLRKMQSEWED